MNTLEDFLRDTMVRAKKAFPEAGFLLISIEDFDEISQRELTVMTNLDQEEMGDVVARLPVDEIPDDEIGDAALHDRRH